MITTNDSVNRITMKSSIEIKGTYTELPIEITADFSNIPPQLHETYLELMMRKY